ncbi:DNA-3-methyladenine glycosylase 2 family protein [Nodosilinea sp. LEGE 07088]|uniref:DNA-3-methyladenine glycosylase family protein n=1 Tax=Nodosilinea sp. LEGE 07088 TaxID=2777968 RepID=UPI001880B0B4|nr:DNA-3-methyladenine glycosylase 2 family protein [Nodosilinea sp. LEGE 07088]MBE9138911.1 DNA-3-methyladenine glycosylase 2 family protein [Nodosilinea sp. LEGE 07088]
MTLMPPTNKPPATELLPPSPALRQAVAVVCDRDPSFQTIAAQTGPLTVRTWAVGFPSLVRIIVGQQLSAKAAQAIFQRLRLAMALTPDAIATAPEVTLKQAGLSRAKIATCQLLSAAILAHDLDLDTLATLSDKAAIAHLTQIKGIGVWTAEVYLLFCLQRLSSFPASDLAIQVGYQRLKHLEHRPTRRELLATTEPLHPYRGAVAHLLWHYYRHLARK